MPDDSCQGLWLLMVFNVGCYWSSHIGLPFWLVEKLSLNEALFYWWWGPPGSIGPVDLHYLDGLFMQWYPPLVFYLDIKFHPPFLPHVFFQLEGWGYITFLSFLISRVWRSWNIESIHHCVLCREDEMPCSVSSVGRA